MDYSPHKLNPCPFCGTDNLKIVAASDAAQVCCLACYCCGPQRATPDEAVIGWNSRRGGGESIEKLLEMFPSLVGALNANANQLARVRRLPAPTCPDPDDAEVVSKLRELATLVDTGKALVMQRYHEFSGFGGTLYSAVVAHDDAVTTVKWVVR